MRHLLQYIFLVLALLSCSHHPGEVRIRGRFAHLEQGEFFLYCSDGAMARMDTLRIKDGEFTYTMPLEGQATLHILYPNYSQLTLFAAGGEDIEVEGDAQNLSEVEVSGSEDNTLYTAFRKAVMKQSQKEARQLARDYVLEHPTLSSSRYLLQQYFLLADSVNHAETREIYDSLLRACPEDEKLLHLSTFVKGLGKLQNGKKIPQFTLKTRPAVYKDGVAGNDTITEADFKDKYLLIAFWASWSNGSQSALYRCRRLAGEMKSHKLPFQAISYSLDASESSLRRLEERDTIRCHSFCDYKTLASPLFSQWNIPRLPYYILVDPKQVIVAQGTDWQATIEPQIKKICL